jgi:PAB1-binding protein PBP1
MDRDSLNQIRDIYNNFFADKNVTVDEAQAQFVEVVKNAPPL